MECGPEGTGAGISLFLERVEGVAVAGTKGQTQEEGPVLKSSLLNPVQGEGV